MILLRYEGIALRMCFSPDIDRGNMALHVAIEETLVHVTFFNQRHDMTTHVHSSFSRYCLPRER